MIKSVLRQLCPPIIWRMAGSLKGQKPKPKPGKNGAAKTRQAPVDKPDKQDLDLYWDPEYAKILEEWGKDNVWNEIQMILGGRIGKTLDIACGTGATIKLLDKFPGLELHGFDISPVLIEKAVEKNIPKAHLRVEDATKTSYRNDEFEYSYSIGSLEHFTLDGIDDFIRESARYTSKASFHMIPISRSGKNEGWMKTTQSFFNNSEGWWLEKFQKHYKSVFPVPSKWQDDISFGRWYICIR